MAGIGGLKNPETNVAKTCEMGLIGETVLDKSKIPKDQDTRTLKTQELKIGGYNCVLEIWSWDGIHGTSFIFSTSDTHELSDDELIQLVLKSLEENDQEIQVTISRSESHDFVNVFFSDD